jgi:subfamily B ATP-binding cassette protein HlyB/CyaB
MTSRHKEVDPGLTCLVAVSAFHQIPANANQLQHEYGLPDRPFGDIELIIAAKSLGLKAKILRPKIGCLRNSHLPAIARAKNGSYFIIARLSTEAAGDSTGVASEVLIQDPSESGPGPVLMNRCLSCVRAASATFSVVYV